MEVRDKQKANHDDNFDTLNLKDFHKIPQLNRPDSRTIKRIRNFILRK